MKKHWFVFYLSFTMGVFSAETHAIACYITLAKDTCWQNYDVTVQVIDDKANNTIATLQVPKGKNWTRQQFDCKLNENFYYKASFSPTIWENQQNVTYRSKRYWAIPGYIPDQYVIWEIKVCYASDFSSIPIPPDANGNCQCDFSGIPAIKTPVIKK